MLQTIEAAKSAAQKLKTFFAEHKKPIKLGMAQDAIARLNGARDWNVFSAQASKQVGNPDAPLTWTYLDETIGFFSIDSGHGDIEGVLVAESPGQCREFNKFHHIEIETFLRLDREIQGIATKEDIQLLDENEENEDIVLDWGDEFDGDGLSTSDLRHAVYLGKGEWKLTDGRIMSFFRTQLIRDEAGCAPAKPQVPSVAPVVSTRTVALSDLSVVMAQIYSDDRLVNLDWDIVPWLKTASKSALIALANSGWENDYPADAVALGMEDSVPDIAALLAYCRKSQSKRDSIGFEVSVDDCAALNWLRLNRPDVYEDVLDADHNQEPI